MRTITKSGSIPAILYFQNEKGHILMVPTDEEAKRFRTNLRRMGYEMYAAETLHQAEELQKKLQAQLKAEQDMELTKDEIMTAMRRKQIRDRLVARRNSSLCPSFERDYIDMWLKIREQKHDIFRKKFTSQVGHLDALEFDNPNGHIHDLLNRQK